MVKLSKIDPAASITLATSLLTLLILVTLHVVSPEFDPSWRMVSEYANGDYSWLLSIFFISWAVSSFALAYALAPRLKNRSGKIGIGFLMIAGVGEAMAALFDINHSLHSPSSFLGIGGSLFAATIISRQLGKREEWKSNHKTIRNLMIGMWLSVGLMIVSFIALVATYMSSGANMTASSDEITTIPEGVIAVVGWANRLVVMTFCAWTSVVAYGAIRLKR